MADFRRWVTVLAMLALFTGLAAAQTVNQGNSSNFSCAAVAQVTPTLRSEGLTELVGDIVLTCTGGANVADGTPIPTVNITVGVTQPITSRLMGGNTAQPLTESLLLIDEPGSGLPSVLSNFGPAAAQRLCPTPYNPLVGNEANGGCIEYAKATVTDTTVGTIVAGTPITVASKASDSISAGFNMFQGILSANNQVTFSGVPVLPPVTTGLQRVYRITNIRVNATNAGASIVSGLAQIQAVIATSNPSVFPLSNSTVTVGYVQPSLTVSATPAGNTFTQCSILYKDLTKTVDSTTQPANVAFLTYKENFPSAFKTRVAAPPAASSYGTSALQNVPGKLYNSESGFIFPGLTYTSGTSTWTAGLADSGTRFQASFAGLPAGAQIYVSQYNLAVSTTSPYTFGQFTPVPAVVGDGTITSLAALSKNGASSSFSGSVTTINAYGVSTMPVAKLSVAADGTATAIWEVLNTNTAQNETLNFGVFIEYTPNSTLTTPTLMKNGGSVVLSYAPLGTQSSPNWIPRFINPNTTPLSLGINIIPCQTLLLFPYVTSASGFDTGIAISNTAEDPLGTQTSIGSCKIKFYGLNAPADQTVGPLGPLNATATPPVYPTAAIGVAALATDFTGYAFAVCDFQFAHGFAFVSDLGARNLAMGYLALVVNNSQQLNGRNKPPVAEGLLY